MRKKNPNHAGLARDRGVIRAPWVARAHWKERVHNWNWKGALGIGAVLGASCLLWPLLTVNTASISLFRCAYLLWTALPPSPHFLAHSPRRAAGLTRITALCSAPQPPAQRGGHRAPRGRPPALACRPWAPSERFPPGTSQRWGAELAKRRRRAENSYSKQF